MSGITDILGRENTEDRRRRVSATSGALVDRGLEDEACFDVDQVLA